MGISRPGEPVDETWRDEPAEVGEEPPDASLQPPEPVRPAPVACPSCAGLVDPPPTRNRLCPHCRQMIVVRHVGGRRAYLTEAAVATFELERQRKGNEAAWSTARRRWLELAATVQAPAARRDRLGEAPISEASVEAARALYLSTADRAVREGRRDKRWVDVGRIRGEQAAALYTEAGSPVPPPDDIVALYREGKSAVLRSLAGWAPNTELVGAECCKPCRSDDGKAFQIARELREPRLPHPGCPKGLCECDWWIAIVDRKPARRRRTVAPRERNPVRPVAVEADDAGEADVAGEAGSTVEAGSAVEAATAVEADAGTEAAAAGPAAVDPTVKPAGRDAE